LAPGSGLYRTTTFRLTVLFGAVFAAGLVLLLGLVYIQSAGYLTRRVDRTLTAEAGFLEKSGPQNIVTILGREAARDPLDSFGLFSATGERVAGETRLTPADLPPGAGPKGIPGRPGVAPSRALSERLPWGEVVIVERDARQLTGLRRIVLGALLWSGAVIAILGLVAGVLLSTRPLRRIQAMRSASEAIGAGDFGIRLPVSGRRDELDELAAIANAMMDEAERSMIQARTVGEGVAHELRTPLTRLRARLDHACQDLAADDPRRPLLEQCVAETDAVLARFRAMLRIAAVEARGRRIGVGHVDLSAIALQIAELYEPVASERNTALVGDIAPGLSVRADGELLLEAISNLVDNALKFTPGGGQVIVRAAVAGGVPMIEVADDGPGIAEDERQLVLKRFYRSDRNANIEGHGLGLSLVAAVADLHGFELSFDNARPGLIVRLLCRSGL
jgi:signal transduction histidine kinase